MKPYKHVDNDLTSKEQYLLALGVALFWYRKQLDDVTQFRLHLSNKDFKAHSEQQNLQRRLERLGAMEEDFSEEVQKYQLSNLDKLPFFGAPSSRRCRTFCPTGWKRCLSLIKIII